MTTQIPTTSENPSLVLFSPQLLKDNYHSWAKATMISKNKNEFVDVTIRKLANTDKKFIAWQRCNTLVISLITHSIFQSIVLWIDVVVDVWNDLRDCFFKGTYRSSHLAKTTYLYRNITRI